MEPDFLGDDYPPLKQKTPAAAEKRSPIVQTLGLCALVLIGFFATSAAISFGPETVQYLRELASRSPETAAKSASETERKSKRPLIIGKPLIIETQPIIQYNVPIGDGFSRPSSGVRGTSSGFSIHR